MDNTVIHPMATATVVRYSRSEILQKRVAGAPDRCGRPLRKGGACPCVPTYKSELGFACGKHVKSIEGALPPPPPAYEDECPICYEMRGKDDTATTDCGHTFCKACIRKLKTNDCPICRQQMYEPTDFEKTVLKLVEFSRSVRCARESARLLLLSLSAREEPPSQWMNTHDMLDTIRNDVDGLVSAL